MKYFAALKQAEQEYAQMYRAQGHLAPDSDGYANLGPIVPWILNRASVICGMTVEDLRVMYYSSAYGAWYKTISQLGGGPSV